MTYADIILPLPLEGYFTYAVPEAMRERLRPGCRVRVPLGKTKTYTGIVAQLRDALPATMQAAPENVRPIVELMDAAPVLLPDQLRLWQWIADYYMAPIGDVYKAALPAGLKAEEDQRPKTERYVALADNYRTAQSLRAVMGMLHRAVAQQKVLRCYLSMVGADEENPVPRSEITREELMNESHCTAAVLRQLTDKKILRVYEKEVGRIPLGGTPHPERVKPLNEAQAEAYDQILSLQLSKDVTLLHGVTSSGKTEIYIHLIQKALDEGRQVLYLLPEIALTVQIMQRLRNVFGDRLGIYHSRYSDAERVEIWRRQLSDRPYDVVLGARSAVFLPFQRLGLVIVDEEHEQSFKQMDPAPRYHARSVATVLARMMGAKTLLGTATPSSESYWNAVKAGKYGYVRLDKRYQDMALPEVEVVDVKDLRRRKMMTGNFSPRLLAAIREAIGHGRQVILFQNRRGFAPRVECHVCGWTPRCPNCDVSLTYHKVTGALTCHYCGYTTRVPDHCPSCESRDVRGRGFGTEKVEDELQALVPEARIARMDLDTTRTKNAYERIISEFAQGQTNVLVGTQMVTKGLDFDHVGVVGILNADAMLNIPDFRAFEQAFAMLSQVSGRAGRKNQRGLVILQTRQPDSPIVRQVVNHDYLSFYEQLFEERRLFRYPPFTHLTYIYLKHRQENTVETAAVEMGGRLRGLFGDRVLGPDKPAVARVKTLHIRKLVLKLELGIDLRRVRQSLREVQMAMMKSKIYGALQIYYDVDPL